MKHITENNQFEKSISSEMLNFCPLCVAEVYALRCDAVFLYLQNLYLSTSKSCIKMGIPSLNIGIKIKFDFPFLRHHFDDIVQI